MTRRRFVVLDRDGTIIVERHYLSDANQVELLPSTAKGLRQIAEMGMGLVIVTNQSGVGRGFFDEARLAEIHQRLQELLAAAGVYLDGIYYCPHIPDDGCLCRKPQIGLLQRAAQELEFDLQDSFVIGDKPCDIELGKNAGATTILVRTGYGAEVAAKEEIAADFVVDDLWAAAQTIGQQIMTIDRGITDAAKY